MLRSVLKYITLSLFVISLTLGEAFAQELVKEVVVSGINKFSRDTVLSYAGIDKGRTYSQEQLNKSIADLYKTGLFMNVSINVQNGVCEISVEENPTVYKIEFEGNYSLKDDEIRNDMLMRERGLFSQLQLQKDVETIINVYNKKGKYAVDVKPKIVKTDKGKIKLVYEINEGPTSKINKIIFIGNDSFGQSKLESIIASKPYSILRILSSEDIFDQDKMQYDKEVLARFYMENGFADFEIKSALAELSSDKKRFNITYAMSEGPLYKFGKVDVISHISEVSPIEISKLCKISEGSTFNATLLSEVTEKITEYLGERGYAFVDVDYAINKDIEGRLANISIVINPTGKVYVDKINITGNTRTIDSVIRRELRVVEGSPYSVSNVKRSKQRVHNLGFFKEVEFENSDPKGDVKDKVDLNIKVKEMPTGGINFGIAYNTDDGAMGMVSYSEKNFLGRGQELEIAMSKAKRSLDGAFKFTEPYFMGMPIAVGMDIFSTAKDRIKESSYKYKVAGFGLHSNYSLFEHLMHRLRYSLKRENIYDITSDASQFITTQAGKFNVSSIGQTFVYDKLDDYLSPKDGYMARFDQDLAGVGGHVHYFRNKLYVTYYKPIYKKNVIMNLRANTGIITAWKNDTVRLGDRFFIGGDEIRGFNYGGIGPRDKNTLDSLGGTKYYVATAEIQFPIEFVKNVDLTGAVFIDAGSLAGLSLKNQDESQIFHDSALRSSAGIGIVWNAGILGTKIRLDYGIPLKKQAYDKKKKIRFFIGYEP